jgi:hypothetical protein
VVFAGTKPGEGCVIQTRPGEKPVIRYYGKSLNIDGAINVENEAEHGVLTAVNQFDDLPAKEQGKWGSRMHSEQRKSDLRQNPEATLEFAKKFEGPVSADMIKKVLVGQVGNIENRWFFAVSPSTGKLVVQGFEPEGKQVVPVTVPTEFKAKPSGPRVEPPF